jgi:hypothetical protein
MRVLIAVAAKHDHHGLEAKLASAITVRGFDTP